MRATVREGVIAGTLGATSVAVWFFVIDLIMLYPFATPYTLGRALFGMLGQPAATAAEIPVVLGYTLFHYLAFILVGIGVALIVRRAETEPSLLAGALILFVIFEVAFHALLSIFGSIPVLGAMAWYNVAIGNLIAAVTMGTYIWRAHPELKGELAYAMGERE
jgi:hypothetical protein